MKSLIIGLIIFLNYINLNSQTVNTLTGSSQGFLDGIGTNSQFNFPMGICSDGNGNLYVSDSSNNKIRKIEISSGIVSTFAGSTQGYYDSVGTSARFHSPAGICYDGNGNLYVSDSNNSKIRKINISTKIVTTIAGSSSGYLDGIGIIAKFISPFGICSDGNGNLYVVDIDNNKIRKIEISSGIVSTLAGSTIGLQDGIGTNAKFYGPHGICYDGNGNLFVTDCTNNKIRKIQINTGEVSTFLGYTIDDQNNQIDMQYNTPGGLCSDGNGNLYLSQLYGNHIKKINIYTNEVTTIAGSITGYEDNIGILAKFNYPWSLCLNENGNIFVADSNNNRIREISFLLNNNQFNINNTGKIFPNPAKENLTLKLDFFTPNQEITITDILGKTIHNQILDGLETTINTNNLEKGIYFLNLIEGSNKITKKFIKE